MYIFKKNTYIHQNTFIHHKKYIHFFTVYLDLNHPYYVLNSHVGDLGE